MLIRNFYMLFVAAYLISFYAYADRRIMPEYPTISYVNFQSLDSENPHTLSAQLRVPMVAAEEKIPAVVIVHGSAGVDSRGSFYAKALNDAGIATLEIDMWAARGWLAGIHGRPRGVPETLPDAYGALQFLSELPSIDSKRIGIMGFSWGGVVTMLTATVPYTSKYMKDNLSFSAHVAQYPVCWAYNRVPGYEFSEFTGAPVLIQAAELDDYDKPDTCQNLVDLLSEQSQEFISVRVYSDVFHAWDRLQPTLTIFDPYSHLGAGGDVKIVPNPEQAFQSRKNVSCFFKKAFGVTD